MDDKEIEFMNLINHLDLENSSKLFRGLLFTALITKLVALYTLKVESNNESR